MKISKTIYSMYATKAIAKFVFLFIEYNITQWTHSVIINLA